jgi:hypothetical protein
VPVPVAVSVAVALAPTGSVARLGPDDDKSWLISPSRCEPT